MLTIPEIDEIAKRATERIAKEFAESGFANPPVVTHGIARAVIEAAEQSVHLTAFGYGWRRYWANVLIRFQWWLADVGGK